jgi:hypothetical protein
MTLRKISQTNGFSPLILLSHIYHQRALRPSTDSRTVVLDRFIEVTEFEVVVAEFFEMDGGVVRPGAIVIGHFGERGKKLGGGGREGGGVWT